MIKLRESMTKKEEGFTLIELMVVVLIIAILIAIAIPTFLGARKRAQDRAAQSDLRNGLTAEKVYYTDNEVFTEDTASMQGIEPSLTWLNSGTPDARREVLMEVSDVVLGDSAVVCLTAHSMSGTNFSIKDTSIGTGAGTLYFKVPSCAGTGADKW
ncbi:MAG: prepilin-type N-terminal cleavage/methylation domain-containing protein [Actinomycetota bacterium]